MPVTKVNGASIHYHVQGFGVPIVFIHPPLLTRVNFQYQTAQLSDLFKVITFDIRGHGHSPFSEQPITYPMIAEDIKQLLDVLHEEKAYLCGYSTGGSIVLEAMLAYPQRFLGGIVVSGMSEMSDWWNRSRANMAIAMISAKAKDSLALSITLGNADSRTTFNNLYQDAKHGNVENWRQYYAYSLGYNCTKRVAGIGSPMLLLYGQKDKVFHRYAKILHERLPDSELIYIPKAKHQLPTKSALHINELIRRWVIRRQTEVHTPEPANVIIPSPQFENDFFVEI